LLCAQRRAEIDHTGNAEHFHRQVCASLAWASAPARAIPPAADCQGARGQPSRGIKELAQRLLDEPGSGPF